MQYIATAMIATLAYLIGYHRGHVAALALPYAILAEKMEELMGRQNESHSEIIE